MANLQQVEKTRVVIQGFLALLGKKILRTELVKLVYLADNAFYESTGRTITGNGYMWDHHGPNAIGSAIVSEANELANLGTIRMAERLSMYGGDAYQYWIDNPNYAWEIVVSRLDAGERQILMDVVNKFGELNMSSLVKRSKETQPFINAQQYDVLQLKQNENAAKLIKKLDAVGEFLEEVESGLEDAEKGQWVWDEELNS